MPSNNFWFQWWPWQAQVRRVKQLQAVLLFKAASNLSRILSLVLQQMPQFGEYLEFFLAWDAINSFYSFCMHNTWYIVVGHYKTLNNDKQKIIYHCFQFCLASLLHNLTKFIEHGIEYFKIFIELKKLSSNYFPWKGFEDS